MPHTATANDNAPALDLYKAQQAADIVVRDYGTMWSFTGQTEAGRGYLADDLQTEGWQWHGTVLMVDHRPARDLLAHMADACPLDIFLV